jgi:hypothetical protein
MLVKLKFFTDADGEGCSGLVRRGVGDEDDLHIVGELEGPILPKVQGRLHDHHGRDIINLSLSARRHHPLRLPDRKIVLQVIIPITRNNWSCSKIPSTRYYGQWADLEWDNHLLLSRVCYLVK